MPFCRCDGRRISLWYLSAGLRYTTHDLSIEFLGYLHRIEGVSYARGELGRRELVKFVLERHASDLEYRESMMESLERDIARQRRRKVPPARKFQPYAHPLRPDHSRPDRYL